MQVQKPWGRSGTNRLEFMEEGSEKTREALAGRERKAQAGVTETGHTGWERWTLPKSNWMLVEGPEQTPCHVGCNGVDLAAGWMPGLRRAWEGGRSGELL